MLVFALLSSHISNTVDEFIKSPLVSYGPMAVSMFLLILYFGKKRIPRSLTQEAKSVVLIAAACLVWSALSAMNAVTGEMARLGNSPLEKLLGLLLVFPAIYQVARRATLAELRISLMTFAIIETFFILLMNSYVGWNPNALSSRVVVCGIILILVSAKPFLKAVGYIAMIVVPFYFVCRTAIVAAICAVIANTVNHKVGRNRGFIIVAACLLTGLFSLFKSEISAGLKDVGFAALKSDNQLSRHLLSDKSKSDITGGDFLDRQGVWVVAWRLAVKHPLFGVGLGNEQRLMGVRSHNAFLGAAVECGVPYAIGWAILVFLLLKSLAVSAIHHPIMACGLTLGVYLLATGMVETSGIASISTPGSIIFYLIGFVSTLVFTATVPHSNYMVPKANRARTEKPIGIS